MTRHICKVVVKYIGNRTAYIQSNWLVLELYLIDVGRVGKLIQCDAMTAVCTRKKDAGRAVQQAAACQTQRNLNSRPFSKIDQNLTQNSPI